MEVSLFYFGQIYLHMDDNVSKNESSKEKKSKLLPAEHHNNERLWQKKNPNKRVKNMQKLSFSLTALRKSLDVIVACLKECYYI